MFRNLFSWIFSLFKQRLPEYPQMPIEIQGKHDCALRALYITLPSTSVEDMISTFTNCCEWWPYRGVSNKEFNIALASLKIKDSFEYIAPESIMLGQLLKRKKDTFIVLVYGHYTVISSGIILDKYADYYDRTQQKVYCCWRLR